MRHWKMMSALLAAILVVSGFGLVLHAQAAEYEDLTIHDLVGGGAFANRVIPYVGLDAGENHKWEWQEEENTIVIQKEYGSGTWWHIFVDLGGDIGTWRIESDAPTPPCTGYSLHSSSGEGDEWGTPTLTGECADSGGGDTGSAAPSVVITIDPTGDAGPEAFLDVVLPVVEGEEPVMAGEKELAAIHVVGDAVSGSCQIIGSGGSPTGASFVHVYVYSVDIVSFPEIVVLLDHWMASYNRPTQEFEFSWDTTELAPGYYDLRLFFQDGTSQTFRIQLTAE